MKRTEVKDFMGNIARSFAKSTGLPVEELIQEAWVGYLEGISQFDFKKGNKGQLRAYIIKCIINKLSSYKNREHKFYNNCNAELLDFDMPYTHTGYRAVEFKETLSKLPEEAKEIIIVVFNEAGSLVNMGGVLARRYLKNIFIKKGVKKTYLEKLFIQIKEVCND